MKFEDKCVAVMAVFLISAISYVVFNPRYYWEWVEYVQPTGSTVLENSKWQYVYQNFENGTLTISALNKFTGEHYLCFYNYTENMCITFDSGGINNVFIDRNHNIHFIKVYERSD